MQLAMLRKEKRFLHSKNSKELGGNYSTFNQALFQLGLNDIETTIL